MAVVKPEPRSQLVPQQPSSNSQDSGKQDSVSKQDSVKQEKVEQEEQQKNEQNRDKVPPVKVRRCAMLRFN